MFSNPRFLSLLIGQGVSYFGDALAAVALPILVLSVTHSGFVMGLIGTLETAPLLVIGLAVGVWVDRWNRNLVMILSDLGRAVLMGLIPAAVMLHLSLMPVIVVVSIVSGTLSVFFGAAYTGTIPRIVSSEQVGRATGYFEAIESAAYALGPVLAGLLSSRIGPAFTLGLDGVSFIVSAVAITMLRQSTDASASAEASPRNFWREMRAGFDAVMHDTVLQSVSLLWAFNRFGFMALISALTFFILRTIHGTSTSVGVAVGVYAAGSLVGTLMAANVKPVYTLVAAVSGQILMCVGALLLTLAHPFAVVLVSAGLMGLGEGIVLVCYLTVRVTRVSDTVVGRVYTTTSTVTQGMGAIGYLVVGGLLSLLGGAATWLILGGFALVSALLILVVMRGRMLILDS